MPSRREYLVVAGSLSLGGCLDNGGASTLSGTTTTTAGTATPAATATPAQVGEAVNVNGAEVTLNRVTTQSSFVYQESADTKGVATREGERFLLAEFGISSESRPTVTQFSIVADGETVSEPIRDYRTRQPSGPSFDRSPYDENGGWLLFPVPAELDAESIRIVVGDVGWGLSDAVSTQLRQPLPTFDIVSFEHPETVETDEEFSVSVTAENIGETTGTFRGVLNVAGVEYAVYPYPFELELDPGESATWTREYGPESGLNEAGDTGSLDLRTPVGDRGGEIEVVDKTSTP
ncbi:hypothetical protein [Halolamina salifodinae]|uniref:CARDB domain-containing protein n=1 Tax=Halolamina salifodinae TaxID=1202767 RepID=A0A8T4GWY0_9EURY|nr:hypothetical protein [Halolamina salifodinae]MBP1987436.1 hypothetical protein [Halolamina salifodinae]